MTSELITLQDALAGEYSIERELGRGGMGIVFLAREVQLDRLVAIKVLQHELASRADVRERFLREARTAARLSHPNIVPIYRVGDAGGLPYFVMGFVAGQTLGERFRDRGPVPSRVLTGILRDVALALAYAHRSGVVHRDIKPDNILLEDDGGRALMTDFGIAATLTDLDASDAAVGTAHFMSPEQLLGERVDGRSDLYSLGLVGYLALTGALPHGDDDVTTVVRRRLSEPVAPVARSAVDVPASLGMAIDRCLARQRDDRFPDAEAVVSALVDAGGVQPRTVLPRQLRAWAGTPVPLMPLYAMWSLSTAISSVSALGGLRWPWSLLGIGAATLPAIPIALFEATRTRRALLAGYTLQDLRLALRSWRTERLEELEYQEDQREKWWAVFLRRVIPISVAGSIVVNAFTFALFPGLLGGDGVPWDRILSVAMMASTAVTYVGVGSIVLMTALGIPLLPPKLRRRWLGRIRSRFWNSQLGEWAVERFGPRRGELATGGWRPTELVLELALDDLFAALPDSYRDHLDELPATVRQLTGRATELRELLTDLEARTLSDELRPSTDDTRTRLGEVVAALERIRLGLLRLHGGMTDLKPLTTALDAARLVAGDVDRLAEAQRDVSGSQRVHVDPTRVPSPA